MLPWLKASYSAPKSLVWKTIISAICDQNWIGLWNLEQKWGWKVIFILWHFLIRGQIRDLVACWLFLAWFGYLGYFWSELNGTLKFGTKWGVKSDFYFMTFFDWRPNKRAIDSFAPAALGQCNSLRARETYQNLSCSFNATSMPNQIKQKMCWDNFL